MFQKFIRRHTVNKLLADRVLKEGLIIGMKVEDSVKWHDRIVYNVRNNNVDLVLDNDVMEDIIMPGNQIILKHTTEYFEYMMDGTVDNIAIEDQGRINLNIHSVNKSINTRAFKRYDIFLPSNIKCDGSKTSYFSIITNLSAGGIAFISKHKFENAKKSEISVILPSKKIFTARGEIVRAIEKSDFYNYGLKFSDTNDKEMNTLNEYLESIDGKREKMAVDFFEMMKKSK
jgi:hypothetical protein